MAVSPLPAQACSGSVCGRGRRALGHWEHCLQQRFLAQAARGNRPCALKTFWWWGTVSGQYLCGGP